MNTNHKIIIGIVASCIVCISVFIAVRSSHEKCKNIQVEENVNSDSIAVKRVHNLIILDESGSMLGLEKVSVGGVNETIQTIREAYHNNPEQEQLLTMVTFSKPGNVRVIHHYDSQDINNVKKMPLNNFQPNGLTPLWDVMGDMCTHLEKEVDNETLVLVTIITDGKENASVEYNIKSIKNLVDRLDKAGWVFTYIGANQDAVFEASSMGIRNALHYDSDEDGTREMWAKERNSRKSFYGRIQTIKSRTQLKRGYFDEDNK